MPFLFDVNEADNCVSKSEIKLPKYVGEISSKKQKNDTMKNGTLKKTNPCRTQSSLSERNDFGGGGTGDGGDNSDS